ncbi:MAG: FAD-dependent oxidoreductase [Oscillospiraceae bacterium]|nr:FAD-dependent oxidoreductase [Oscillospiraceae bacterium]
MESIWQKDSKLPSFPQQKGKQKTEVLIIGGGMTGILTAYFLTQNHVDCMLVEKGKICNGTTAGTTAKITVQHGLLYHRLLKNYGAEFARKYLQANQHAFTCYETLCKNIDCDFVYQDNYVYAIDNREKLEQELAALEKIGYPVAFCEHLPLPFSTAGAVTFSHQAQFHPLKFLAAIAEGLPIYENTFVKQLQGNTAITDTAEITANQILVTTHFPFLNRHGSYFLKLYQHRSYVLALEGAQDVNGMYVEESKTGLSFRNYKNVLLLGGGGHRTGKKGGNWAELRQFAQQHYPQAKECCAWAAQDCMSLDAVPYIGHYSSRTAQLYTATGFNKWGMTGAMLSAQLLRDMVLGKKQDFSDVFSPSRSILKPQLLVNGFEAVKNLCSFSGKRCPHLGCALKWNPAEHSWDCACHGSRFDENGKLLNNPANGDCHF